MSYELRKMPSTCSMYELTCTSPYSSRTNFDRFLRTINREYNRLHNNNMSITDMWLFNKCIIYNCTNDEVRKQLEKFGFKVKYKYYGYYESRPVYVLMITFKDLYSEYKPSLWDRFINLFTRDN